MEDVARKTSKTTAVTSLKSVTDILRISEGQRATSITFLFTTVYTFPVANRDKRAKFQAIWQAFI
jgi:hypothetical protein